MKTPMRAFLVPTLAAGLAGCGGSDAGDGEPAAQADPWGDLAPKARRTSPLPRTCSR